MMAHAREENERTWLWKRKLRFPSRSRFAVRWWAWRHGMNVRACWREKSVWVFRGALLEGYTPTHRLVVDWTRARTSIL
jgi:hypothetical protein